MDIRILKTRAAIRAAFLKLREQLPLEKITVKEICKIAQINKSTFYAHYRDIYDLSDTLEKETVAEILNSISQYEEYSTENPEVFAREVCMACVSHLALTRVVFSGQENSRLAARLENGVKELIWLKYPEYRDDPQKNILLSFCIQGAHHAFLSNRELDTESLVATIGEIIKALGPIF